MPDLTEDVIRQITEKVTREVMAALAPAETWPDYDEYGVPEVTEEAPQVSPLRARLTQGVVDQPVVDDDTEDEPMRVEAGDGFGAVVPVGSVQATVGSGFSPVGNDAWFARNYQKDVVLQMRKPTIESQVKA